MLHLQTGEEESSFRETFLNVCAALLSQDKNVAVSLEGQR